MSFSRVMLFLCALSLQNAVKSQSLETYHVDTAEYWVGGISYYNAITLASDKIIHSFNNSQHYSTGTNIYGGVKINTYDYNGSLKHQEKSYGDSLFIKKVLVTSNGEKIILGDGYQHLGLYGMDMRIAATEGKPNSFILHLNATNQAINQAEFQQINDISLDENANTLYFVEQYNYDSANLFSYSLATGHKSVIATIEGARLNARIVKTANFIYVAGATINFAVYINGQKHATPFAYGTFVMQLNNIGELKWINIIEDITTPTIGLAAAPDEGIYMSSDLSIELVLGKDSLKGPGWGGDFILTRIDSNGNYLWARDIPDISLCGFTLGSGFHIDSDEKFNIFLAGASRGIMRWPDSSTIGRNSNSMVPTLLIYDMNGVIQRHVIAEAGEPGSFFSVDASINGDYVLTGKMTTSQTFSSVTKTVTDGGYHPYFLYYKNPTTNVHYVELQYKKYRIYPNPLSGLTSLVITKDGIDADILEIVNTQGQKVASYIIKNKVSKLQLENLQPGIYFIRINGSYVQKLSLL